MNLSLSTLSKQDSDHLLEDCFVPGLHTMKQEPSEERKDLGFSHGGPGILEVAEGVGRRQVGLRTKEGPFPLVRFLRRSLESRGKIAILGKDLGKVRL